MRWLRIALVTALVAAGLVAAGSPTPAHAYACSGTLYGDFDNDDAVDLVVARTLPTTKAGQIDIRLSGGGTQTFGAASLGFQTQANDKFGAAITIINLRDGDNCPDLVIGSPGFHNGDGAAYVVHGNGHGVALTGASRMPTPQIGSRFGTSVGAMDLPWSGSRLFIGAPGFDAGSVTDAGAVIVSQLVNGVPSPQVSVFTYTDFGAAPKAGDELGSVMSTDYGYEVMLGVPRRDVGAAKDAGEAIVFSVDDEHAPSLVKTWARVSQNTSGAPDTAEAYDNFGAAVDVSAHVVGVPGEDLSGRSNVGMVMRFAPYGHGGINWKAWHQNSTGIPGSNESGDKFGAAVHVVYAERLVDDDPVPDNLIVVGVPGEDVGSIKDAGSVTVIVPSVLGSSYSLAQGAGLPGKVEAGDRVGSSFGETSTTATSKYPFSDGLVIGAPGENVGTVVDSGLVMVKYRLLPKTTGGWTSYANVGTPVAGTQYGWTLPQSS